MNILNHINAKTFVLAGPSFHQNDGKNNHLKISVKPNSRENKIIGYDEDKDEVKVEIAAPPENNKANIEVIKFFRRLTKREVKIKSGLTSKKKLIEFR